MREEWRSAYRDVGEGRDFVRIHLIREALAWKPDKFKQVLEEMASEYEIELHGGDPSQLTAEEIDNSYTDQQGTLYITVSLRRK